MSLGRILILLSLSIQLTAFSVSFAFHEQGVANCSGCHTAHNLQDGTPIDPDNPSGNWSLLNDASPSDLCLSCHASQQGAVFGSNPVSPPLEHGAGNFVFLLEDNLNDGADGASNPIGGDAAGHNINAPSYGVSADGTNATSPGGSFPSLQLSCTSCHDPHGNTNFRMLYGAGQIQGNSFTFTAPAPQAEGLDIIGSPESNSNHTAYLSGMTEWCGNCHGEYHHRSGSVSDFKHGSGKPIGGSRADYYNAYNGTSDPSGGSYTSAYLALVPLEDQSITTTSTFGAQNWSQVTCLTCHRAHASSAPHSGRWDFNVELLEDDGVVSGSYALPNPYGPMQRSLCNKCHNVSDDGSLTSPVQY